MYQIREWLYIGDRDDAHRAGDEDSVASVVSLDDSEVDSWGEYSGSERAYHSPMIDGDDNTEESFESAISAVFEAIEEHGEVLVHCSAGVSRSGTIVATILAEVEECSFSEALAEVRRAKPNVNPHPHLEQQAYDYLGEEHPFEKYRESN